MNQGQGYIFLSLKSFEFKLLLVLLSLTKLIECNPQFGQRPGGGRRFIEDWSEENHQNRKHNNHHPKHVNHNNGGITNLNPIPSPSVLNEGEKKIQTFQEGIKVINEPSSTTPGLVFQGLQGFQLPTDTEKPNTNQSTASKLCPEGQGFYKKTGKCFNFARHTRLATESPCGELMDFYRDPSNTSLGVCDCRESDVSFRVRPIAYWKLSNRCYVLFDQGPCKNQDEWLVINEEGETICRKRSCPQNEKSNAKISPLGVDEKFWFRERGKCYQTNTQGHCDDAKHHAVFENNKALGYVLSCIIQDGPSTRVLTNNIKDLPCKQGYKRSINGECSRAISFE